MNIVEATRRYEGWMAAQVPVRPKDLQLKHESMASNVFPFLRATFYRWVQLWNELCPELAAAPALLAVGDLHVDNFGTWRDLEGRLIWGVNDFDEACSMPYTIDLVRLAASAIIAAEEEDLSLAPADVSAMVLDGYRDAMEAGGAAFVLAERNKWLRLMALGKLRDPVRFWKKINGLQSFEGDVPRAARQLLVEALPQPGLPYELRQRVAGLGSLGRVRVLALANWREGAVAREAKSLFPSAWRWAMKRDPGRKICYPDIIGQAIRVPDPFVAVHDGWLVRRLAPDCCRIALTDLPRKRDEERLLAAMGWETANIHLGNGKTCDAVKKDIKARPARWLETAARTMADATRRDWKAWRASTRQ